MHGRAAGGGNQFHQRAAQQLRLLIASCLVPAPVGVADQTGGVGHQNQALGVVEDLAGEIALALQFGLEVLEVGDVEHEAAALRQSALGVANRESIHQHVDKGAVFATQSLVIIP